jgi:hypothetical protein
MAGIVSGEVRDCLLCPALTYTAFVNRPSLPSAIPNRQVCLFLWETSNCQHAGYFLPQFPPWEGGLGGSTKPEVNELELGTSCASSDIAAVNRWSLTSR